MRVYAEGTRVPVPAEAFPGISLEALLSQGKLELSTCLRIATRLAGALGVLHVGQQIHRAVRPANVMVSLEQGDVRLVAAQPMAALSATDWAYLSPEQTGRMNRTVDHRSDFYSLGVVLYRMLTGELPFQANDAMEWVHCHVARVPRPALQLVPDLPATVGEIIMKLLAKMADDRYQNAAGLQFDLEECLTQWEGRVESSPSRSVAGMLRRDSRSRSGCTAARRRPLRRAKPSNAWLPRGRRSWCW